MASLGYPHLVQIQEQRTERDAGGAAVVTYATVAEVAARFAPLSSRERILNAQAQGRTTHRVYLPYYPGVTVRHRLVKVEDGVESYRTFGILGVYDPDEDRMGLVLDAVEEA